MENTLTRQDFVRGRKFRVVRVPSRIIGMKPIPGGQQGFSLNLDVGTVLTCEGPARGWGSDPGPDHISWTDERGEWICNFAEFEPTKGSMWDSLPADGYLEPEGGA